MPLTVIPVTFPRDLEGVQNGKLPASLLVEVGLRGRLHQLAARAWFALCAEGKAKGWHLTYTFGGCYRTYEEQRALFVQRYQMEPIAGRPTKVWEGVVWYQKPNTAMAAVPGTSNHGLGLAVDAALDLDLSDGVGPGDASSIVPAMSWFHDAALRYGFSFEAQSEPWHIRYVSGDRIPDAVLAYEDSLKPKPPPPPVPTPSEDDVKYVIVGNGDDRSDNRRWLYNGFACRLLTEQDFNEALLLGWLHPSFSSLSSPFWKPMAWINALAS